jgi:hypothetical protein
MEMTLLARPSRAMAGPGQGAGWIGIAAGKPWR